MRQLRQLRLLLCCAVFLASFAGESRGQQGPTDQRELTRFVDSLLTSGMARERIPGAAFCFVRDGRVLVCKGYGLANVQQKRRVSPDSTIFRIGSISKVFTATALVQLADRGAIDLNSDVNRYLRKVRVGDEFPAPVTAEDLLRHTAGFDEIRPGTQAPTAAQVQPLADFLRGRLVRVRAPGTIAYSTYGITLAGELVEEISGHQFEKYLADNIWQPLGMRRTNITVPVTLAGSVAMGYEVAGDSLVPQAWEWYHTTPASSVNSTAADMAKFMIAHLDPGTPRILSDRATRFMQRQHTTMHPRIPGFALGFYEDYVGQLRVIEHGGNMAGFSSQMVLIPEHNAGFFYVGHREGSGLRDEVKDAVLKRYYQSARKRIRRPAPVPDFRSRIGDYTGRYAPMTGCSSCNPRRAPYVMDIGSSRDSASIVFAGSNWIEVAPSLFVRHDGTGYIAFRRDITGKVVELFPGGFWSFERIP